MSDLAAKMSRLAALARLCEPHATRWVLHNLAMRRSRQAACLSILCVSRSPCRIACDAVRLRRDTTENSSPQYVLTRSPPTCSGWTTFSECQNRAFCNGARRFGKMLKYRGVHGHVHLKKSVDAAFYWRAPFLGHAKYRPADGNRCGEYHHDVKGSLSKHEDFRGRHKGGKARFWPSTTVAKDRGHRLQFHVVLGFHHVHELLGGVVDRTDDGTRNKACRSPVPEVLQACFCKEVEQVNQWDGKDDTAQKDAWAGRAEIPSNSLQHASNRASWIDCVMNDRRSLRHDSDG